MRAESSAGRGPFGSFACLTELLEHHAKRIHDSPAILAPGRAGLTYGRLSQHVQSVGRTLRAMGIGRDDRVAVALPNGPEMAVAILGVAANATCAPINPAYRTEELDRYFADVRPRALIAPAGIETAARRAALARGIGLIELAAAPETEAGLFTLRGEQKDASPAGSASCDDVALLIATSGTTSRTKIVPQTHHKVCASACAHAAALELRETDRALNILPLFHGHGLIATVLASLAAGASVVCAPMLELASFPEWLIALEPTWYSAVPAMHQAILGHFRRDRRKLSTSPLRFIRSSSAPLSPRILAELEQTFGTCVIEWYGMTEVAASPIACNPLPPRPRKPGSVGVPVALDVAIIDEGGGFLPHRRTGEVVVRGATVMQGYDGDAIATGAAFAGEWLKTGDLGFSDDDGYLFLTGRLREMINRGGEKIAPREVDEALMEHPAVAEAVTFSVPHATLGEDVAAAIVLRPGIVASAKEIRRFAGDHIAAFKVPRQLLIVDKIPKTSTGKVQRVGLASKLGLAGISDRVRTFVAPRTLLERLLATRWAEILQVERIGIHNDFFTSGGDSLLATHVLGHIYEVTKIELEVARFFEAPNVADVARHLEESMRADRAPRAQSAPVRAGREDGAMPASFAQERLCKLQDALPGIPFFNVLYALRISSRCEAAVLERSINEIVRRHEILRTTFAIKDGRYVQVIAPRLSVVLVCKSLAGLPRRRKETVAHKFIQKEALHSFDLTKGPLIRARLIHLAQREHLLLISLHQIVCDGWSLGILVEELTALYDALSTGRQPSLPPLPIQYADFAQWQRRWELHPLMLAQLAYWRVQLRDLLPSMQLAGAVPGGRVEKLCTARRAWGIPARLGNAVRRFGHENGATLFMALAAGLNILLHRYLDQDDVRVATNVANRNRPGTAGLIGPLVNTVILRTSLAGDPAPREVLRRVRETTLAAFANQDFPIEAIARMLQRERGLNPAALANVMIILQNAGLRPQAASARGLTVEEAAPDAMLPLVTTAGFDVILTLHDGAHGLRGTCVYKPHLFAPSAIDRLLRDFQQVIERMVMHPERPVSAIRVLPIEQTLHG